MNKELLKQKIKNNNQKFKDFLGLNITSFTGMETGSRDRKREMIRIRDNNTCQICGLVWKSSQRRFDVHHIDCDNRKTRKADNLKSEWNNMITLCHKCHLSLPEHKETMQKAFRKNNKK
jgi:5-methylcytosine-specific restriction endonuclease McrA